MAHVFVCYKHEDKRFAVRLRRGLEEAGFEVWMDEDLQAGVNWREEIDHAIRSAFALIVIMTPQARESEYVTYEWACAWGAKIPVIPLMIKATELHPRLEAFHYLNFMNSRRPWKKLMSRMTEVKEKHDAISSVPNSPLPGGATVPVGSQEIYERLFSNDEWEFFSALDEFKSCGETHLTNLSRFLKSDSAWRRRRAVTALGEIATILDGAVQASVARRLGWALEDPDWQVRKAAEGALEEIGSVVAQSWLGDWRSRGGSSDPPEPEDLPF
jgi:hypothetical protein